MQRLKINLYLNILISIIALQLQMFSLAAYAEPSSGTPWRTYALARDWDMGKALGKCSGDSYYGKLYLSVNVRCEVFSLWSSGKLIHENVTYEQMLAQESGYLGEYGVSRRLKYKELTPHVGIVGMYRDRVYNENLIMVRVQFVDANNLQLTPDVERPLYNRIEYELGLVEFSNSDEFPTTMQHARDKFAKNDQEKADIEAKTKRDEQERQAERERTLQAQREASRPKCEKIKFTGYATIYPQHLFQVYQAKNPEEIIADHPIICTNSAWGGHYTSSGAVINQNSMTECKGVGYFKNQLAEILDWKGDIYRVNALVQFDTGRRQLGLFIRKKDSRCEK